MIDTSITGRSAREPKASRPSVGVRCTALASGLFGTSQPPAKKAAAVPDMTPRPPSLP